MAIQQNSGGWVYDPISGGPIDKRSADNAQARLLEVRGVADRAVKDVDAIKTLNGVAPGDPYDAATSLVLGDPESQSYGRIQDAFVASTDVGRIIVPDVTGRPDIQFVVQPPDTFFTDFTEYEHDQFPEGFEIYGNPTGKTWRVLNNSAASGGVDLLVNGPSGNTISHPVWAAMMAGQVEGELAFKYQAENVLGGSIRGVMLASGRPPESTAGAFTDGLSAGYMNANQNGIREAIAGTAGFYAITTVDPPRAAGVWYTCIMRREGAQFYYKEWPAGATEPSAWQNSLLSPRLWDGWVGLTATGSVNLRIDWVGFRAGPGVAPRGA